MTTRPLDGAEDPLNLCPKPLDLLMRFWMIAEEIKKHLISGRFSKQGQHHYHGCVSGVRLLLKEWRGRGPQRFGCSGCDDDSEVAALAAYDEVRFRRCHSMVGFVPGSGVLRDGELTAADKSFRDLLDWKRKPIIVVAFGDNVTANGDAAADRQLAIHRAAFVTQRLKSLGVHVGQPLAIGGPGVRGSATSAEMYFSCPSPTVTILSTP